ncbi:MarC family protein [Methylobacterium sp. WL9]|uniref:MarC family protein n=1 Tax=Methylobacterium sp. WL9 TaxID=2603898 RepID=UPI0011C874C8|nr:MarC family protein [Methylobacterium sp. WL9]TXN19859.1 NAAT family transporter [Methylobacterium sp. WL9]
MTWWILATQSFLAAASALFSIVNPLGGALIFAQITGDRTHAQRTVLARRVMIYAAIVMMSSLWIGAYVVDFFGVSISALRVAGGLVVAASGWRLLNAPEKNDDKKQAQAEDARGQDDIAFFPLTLPLTTGPGSIAVAIALGSNRPAGGAAFAAFATGTSAAALAIALTIGLTYSWADWITDLLGQARIRIIARLAAFILLCIGVQITMNGVLDALSAQGCFSGRS